ncbi:MAG: SGNH/GDSL hydrolase family protein [Roseimicrobium sp.]
MKILFPALFVFATAVVAQTPRPSLEFMDGDSIVLLGGTLTEREQKFGFLETALMLGAPDKKLSVRNLGWSGDTVFGHARSYFGPPEEGITRLSVHLEMLKPSVAITCYGADMPFEGLAKLPDFITGYRKLLEIIRSKNPNVRVIIVSPPPFENLGAPLPDLTEANATLAKVRDALKEFAIKQGAMFVDTFTLMGGAAKERPKQPLTDNGLHYTEAGYKIWSTKLAEALGLPKTDVTTPEATALRQAIVKKDFLFFNRWRPANETYLFGFRKHEQGQNAKEMEQFDPIVEAQEKKMAELKTAALAAKKLP